MRPHPYLALTAQSQIGFLHLFKFGMSSARLQRLAVRRPVFHLYFVFMIGIWKWQNVKDGSCRDECPVNESVFRCLRVPSFGGVARLQPLKGHKSYGDTGGDTGLTT